MLALDHTPAFCDTFFENVRVPKDNLVGPLHGGWTLAKALLGHERTMVAAVGKAQRTLRHAKRLATETQEGDKSLLQRADIQRRLSHLEMRLHAHQMTKK
jgi:alkylation response protein AidB-like acyl-CoA dehydrogenase